mmetsp:Transcript_2081/g.6162  ORF Transcript_2081/g.6162 Transcript_2081/m.6162 type:complete len:342 (-) Transcript_2081:1027-2052(-)
MPSAAAVAPERKLKAERDAVREEVMAAALKEFKEKPRLTEKKQKRRWLLARTRRYYGVCYWKNMHEAVVDGDGHAVVRQMRRAQKRDRARVQEMGGVERAEDLAEDGDDRYFVGSAVKRANAYDARGRTPLALAVKEEREDVVELLLRFQGNPNKADLDSGTSPLLSAILADLPGVAVTLADAQADVDCHAASGLTPLMLASVKGDVDVVELLLERGADVDAADRSGWTALHYAAVGGHLAPTKQLLRAGASKKAKDNRGFTPTHFAAFMRHRHDNVLFQTTQAAAEATLSRGTQHCLDHKHKKDDPVASAIACFPTTPDADPPAYGEVEAFLESFTAKLV